MKVPLAVGILLLLALPGPIAAAGPDEWVRELEPGGRTWEDTLLLQRVVDYWTGRPIPGARADLFWEDAHPTPGFGTPIASGVAGEDGWLRVPVGEHEHGAGHWVYVSADGYAPDARFGDFWDETVALRPPEDVEIEFRDPLGRPVKDLGVSLLLGCGHAPDVRMTRTDWRGRATLRDVQTEAFGQVWLFGPGIRSEYGPLHSREPGDPPLLHQCAFSHDVCGRVLRHDGTPAVGVAAGLSNYHRGPWTRTDAFGRFRLHGAALDPGNGSICVDPEEAIVGESHSGRAQIWFVVPPPDFERVIRLPPPGEEYEEEEETASFAVRVKVEGGAPLPDGVSPWVIAVRDGDAWTDGSAYDEERDRLVVDCPPGPYTLIATLEDECCSYPGLSSARVHATAVAGAETEVTLEVLAPRMLRLDVGDLGGDASLAVVAEAYESAIDAEPVDGLLVIPVPATGPIHLGVSDELADDLNFRPLARVFEIPAVHLEAGGAPFAVPAPEQHWIRARFLDAGGDPVRARARVGPDEPWARDPASIEIDVQVPPQGTGWLWIDPVGEEFAPRRFPLPRPLPAVWDLGDLVFEKRAPARLLLGVLDCAGEPAEGAKLRVVRGRHRLEASAERPRGRDEAGIYADDWGPMLAIGEGAEVYVLARSREDVFVMPWRAVLRGPEPFTIAAPRGRLVIRVVDEAGEALLSETDIEIDGELVKHRGFDPPNAVEVAGLAPGPHDVVLRAPDHRGLQHRVVLEAGEQRTIEVVLRR